MDDKDRFDACLKLSGVAAGRLDFRRQLEWRLCIAIWTALVAGIAWFRVEALPIWVGAAILIAHGYWLQSLYVRHAADTEILWHYFTEAQRILAKEGVASVAGRPELRVGSESSSAWSLARLARRKIGFLSSWALGFEFFVTLALTAILYQTCAQRLTWLTLTPLHVSP